MRAERPTDLAIPRSVKVVKISTLQCLSSVHSLWHPPAAAYVGWTSQCNETPLLLVSWSLTSLFSTNMAISETTHHSCHPAPAQVNPCRLLVLPVKSCCTLCQSPRRTVSVPVRQLSNAPVAAWTRVSFSVFHTMQSSAAVHWSVNVMQTMHAARRPTARPSYRGRCVSYDIAIWNATIYRLTCWATIWSLHPPHPIFGPYLVWPNGWMDEDTTWYGSRPRPRPHCIRPGLSYPRKGHSSPPLFGPCLLWPWSPISATAELL